MASSRVAPRAASSTPSSAKSWRPERPGRAEAHADGSRSRIREEASAVNAHALNILELPRALDVVAGFATSNLGADARARALADHGHVASRPRARARRRDARSGLGATTPGDPTPYPISPHRSRGCESRERRGAAPSSSPAPSSFARRAARRTSCATRGVPRWSRAVLAPLLDVLISRASTEDGDRARRSQDDGVVKDDASPALRRIRRELRAAQAELIRILEREMERLEPHHRVPDMSVTVRNGRYVIPVRREADRSRRAASSTTRPRPAGRCSSNPPAAVEFGNRIRELEYEEIEEVDRILLELTDKLRPHRDAMIATLDALVELDSALRARALRRRLPVRAGDASSTRERDSRSTTGAIRSCSRKGVERRPVRPRDDGERADAARVGAEHRRQDRAAQGARADLGAARSRACPRRSAPRAACPSSTTSSPTSATSSRSRRASRRSARTSRTSARFFGSRPRTHSSWSTSSDREPIRSKARRWAGRFSRTSRRAVRSRSRRRTSARSRSSRRRWPASSTRRSSSTPPRWRRRTG